MAVKGARTQYDSINSHMQVEGVWKNDSILYNLAQLLAYKGYYNSRWKDITNVHRGEKD